VIFLFIDFFFKRIKEVQTHSRKTMKEGRGRGGMATRPSTHPLGRRRRLKKSER
jgi:hypothetical protein